MKQYQYIILSVVIGYIAASIFMYLAYIRKLKREKQAAELVNGILRISILVLKNKISFYEEGK